MSKTPEEMAEEYLEQEEVACDAINHAAKHLVKNGFLAGFQAAKNQVAHVTKVTKPTDTIGREELRCMIAHFENDDYKISVMVPGIPPKDDGGKLVCGCGLLVYDILTKVV